MHGIPSAHIVDAELMYHRFGHLGYSSLSKMSRSNTVTNLPPPSAFSKELHSSKQCGACAESRQKKATFTRTPKHSSNSEDPFTATKPLEKLHVDISGPRSQSAGGHHWFTAIVDDVTGFKFVTTHRSKSEAADEVIAVVRRLNNQYSKRGFKVSHIRWDKDAVFRSKRMQQFLRDEGITDGRTAGYSPEENGHAERAIASLKNCFEALLADSGLKDCY
jgi:transposase InsO family protein